MALMAAMPKASFPEWLEAFKTRVIARPRLQGANVVYSVLSDLALHGPECMTVWGLWLEFGLYNGSSLRATAGNLSHLGHSDTVVYGFDSFQGLPTNWGNFPAGSFSTHGQAPQDLPANTELVVGWFNETLPVFLDGLRAAAAGLLRQLPRVQWLHLDCDTYGSHREVLFALSEFLVPGTVIIFDDLLNYPTYTSGGLRALFKFQVETCWSFEVVVAPWMVDWKFDETAGAHLQWFSGLERGVVIELKHRCMDRLSS